MSQVQDFTKILASYECAISYHPFGHEPMPEFSFIVPSVVYTVPKDHTTDPMLVAEEAKAIVGERLACMFIPGTAFDATGTRHGRGGGWYDRFLAAVPADWLRIGVCTKAEFSTELLTRETWDQPVDWVLIKHFKDWKCVRTDSTPHQTTLDV